MSDVNQDELLDQVKAVFQSLLNHDDRLTKQQILEVIGPNHDGSYGVVVDALANIGKITKISGRAGGIRYSPAKARQRRLTQSNLNQLRKFLSDSDLEVPEVPAEDTQDNETIQYQRSEETLYSPLQQYLLEGGEYDFVEEYGDTRGGGGTWKNPDLIALSYSANLKYHAGLNPKVTAIEVKYHWPTIKDLQQTASYLRFCHRTYICFYDSTYKGSDVNRIITKLKNEEIWEWSDLYGCGIIVAFRRQHRSTDFAFQTVREAPHTMVDPDTLEQGIDTYFSESTTKALTEAMRKHIKSLI